MNKEQVYKVLEIGQVNEKEKSIILDSLAEEFNHPAFNIASIFQSDDNKRAYRAFFIALANSDTLERWSNLLNYESEFNVMVSHLLITRFSNHAFPSQRDFNSLVKILQSLSSQYEEVGTTLSQSIGYLIGKNIYYGNDVSSLHVLCKKPFIISKEHLFSGFSEGYNSSAKGLVENSSYISSLVERYEEWNSVSFKLSFELLALKGTYDTLENPIFNPANEKILWFLKGIHYKNPLVNNLINFYQEHSEEINPPKIQEVIKEVLVEVPVNSSYHSAVELSRAASIIKENLQLQLNLAAQRNAELLNEEKPKKTNKYSV